MRLNYSPHQLAVTIEDRDRALWLDGSAIYYKMPKDYRPDINPFDLEDAYQAYYQLERLTSRKTSSEINEALDNLKKLADIYVGYCNHTLGLIIEQQYSPAQRGRY